MLAPVIRLCGPASALPQVSATWRSRTQEVDQAYSTSLLGGCPALQKPQDTAPAVGKHSLRCGTTGAGSGHLVLGHPGTTGNCRRAENEMGVHGLDITPGLKGE